MKRTNGRTQNSIRALLGAGALGVLASSGGCLNYSNYPPEPGTTWINARDTASIREPMAKALKHVIEQDIADQTNLSLPADGPLVAINLPGGIMPESYRWVAANAGGRAVPLSESGSTDGLPIYHIGQVRIRGRDVRVDVLRPITGLERGVDRPVYVGVEVWMEGSTGTRQIDRMRWREVGTLDTPELYTIESVERAFTARTAPESEAAPEGEASPADSASENASENGG